MPDALELWEQPTARQIDMLAGWRQWADAGSVSSGLPQYLIDRSKARRIGAIRPGGFYLFQIPGTHDLVRPVVKFDDGYPASLETRRNELYYTGDEERGTVIFLGDEPHLDVEGYTDALLQAARTLKVRRIVGCGGVYGELPYNKERMISGIYSLPRMREEMNGLAVDLSNYEGGASIESVICRRANEQGMEFVGLYAFVPAYTFSDQAQAGESIRIENDFTAWLGVMRRINYMLRTTFDLTDLEKRSAQVTRVMDAKIEELERSSPELGVREYLARLTENFTEVPFAPLGDMWEEEFRRLFDDSADDEDSQRSDQ